MLKSTPKHQTRPLPISALLRTTSVRLPQGASFVIANSLAESNKAAGCDYNARVAECRLATKVLAKHCNNPDWKTLLRLGDFQSSSGLTLAEAAKQAKEVLHEAPYSLKEITSLLGMTEDEVKGQCLNENTKNMTEFRLRNRALHVFSEAKRVYDFKEACEKNASLTEMGELMYASHKSCAEDYQCSHPQLDELVGIAGKRGALGARLTGAGWGGCIVALVQEADTDAFIEAVKKDYFMTLDAAKGKNLDEVIFKTQPGQGAVLYEF